MRAYAAVRQLKIQDARQYRTLCPYCAVGCGTIAYVHGSGGLNRPYLNPRLPTLPELAREAPGAVVQYVNGIVDFRQESCIGCRFCVSACPFDIPRFDEATQKVYKCNLCIDRVEAGLEPACVKTCPTQAISWGTKHEMLALGEKKVAALRARGLTHATLYDPEGVGGTHEMYVLPHGDRVADYSLPEDPRPQPGALDSFSWLRPAGAWLFGLGVLGTRVHYLTYGPLTTEAVEEGPEEAP